MSTRQADRTAPPHKYEIALYWTQHEALPGCHLVYDLGEPQCFACEWYSERWPKLAGDGERGFRRLWAATRGLGICHLVPHALGGSSEVSNMVLLCERCHMAAPDFRVPGYMLKWIQARPNFLDSEATEIMTALQHAFAAFGRDWPPTQEDAQEASAVLSRPDFRQFYKENVVASPATSRADQISSFVAAFCEYTANRPKLGELFAVSPAGLYLTNVADEDAA